MPAGGLKALACPLAELTGDFAQSDKRTVPALRLQNGNQWRARSYGFGTVFACSATGVGCYESIYWGWDPDDNQASRRRWV